MTIEEMIEPINRFSGFDLQKRLEWKHSGLGEWRVRILPNKAERQDYRIEEYSESPEGAIAKAIEKMQQIREENR